MAVIKIEVAQNYWQYACFIYGKEQTKDNVSWSVFRHRAVDLIHYNTIIKALPHTRVRIEDERDLQNERGCHTENY